MKIPMHLDYKGYDKEKNTYEMNYGQEKYSLDLKTFKQQYDENTKNDFTYNTNDI